MVCGGGGEGVRGHRNFTTSGGFCAIWVPARETAETPDFLFGKYQRTLDPACSKEPSGAPRKRLKKLVKMISNGNNSLFIVVWAKQNRGQEKEGKQHEAEKAPRAQQQAVSHLCLLVGRLSPQGGPSCSKMESDSGPAAMRNSALFP